MAFNIEEEVLNKYLRVLNLARTPTRDEFSKIAIVAAVGIALIGLVGFVVYELMFNLPN